MLDFKSDFINNLINIRTAQFSKDVTGNPADVLNLTATFQSEMKSLVEEQQIPRKYQLHYFNLQLAHKYLFQEDEKLSNEIKLKDSRLKEAAVALLKGFLETKIRLLKVLKSALSGFDESSFEKIAADFNTLVKLFLEQRKIVVAILHDIDGPGTGPQPALMQNLVSHDEARLARAREMERQAEEDRKRKEAQAQQQRDIENADRLTKIKQARLAAQKNEAQEKAKREEEQRQRQQEQQRQAQSSSTSKADFELKRQQILSMHQQQLAITPALGLSRQVDQQKLTVKKMVDEELAAIEARRYTSSYIVQQCDLDFENKVKANMPTSVADVQALLAKRQRDVEDMQERQREMDLQYQYQREQQAAYDLAQAEQAKNEQRYERRYNYA